MVHFKALAKFYGVSSTIANLPEPVWQATQPKFMISTPDAQVQSISASKMDKHLFVKFLVGELSRVQTELQKYASKAIEESMKGQQEVIQDYY